MVITENMTRAFIGNDMQIVNAQDFTDFIVIAKSKIKTLRNAGIPTNEYITIFDGDKKLFSDILINWIFEEWRYNNSDWYKICYPSGKIESFQYKDTFRVFAKTEIIERWD